MDGPGIIPFLGRPLSKPSLWNWLPCIGELPIKAQGGASVVQNHPSEVLPVIATGGPGAVAIVKGDPETKVHLEILGWEKHSDVNWCNWKWEGGRMEMRRQKREREREVVSKTRHMDVLDA